jgi:hypothetical protein
MKTGRINIGDDGIPVLEARVDSGETDVDQQSIATAPQDSEQLRHRLQTDARQMLDDLTEDLQQTVLWKLEAILKDEMGKVIHEAIRESAPRIQQDLNTQLELALPDLLASLLEKNTPED